MVISWLRGRTVLGVLGIDSETEKQWIESLSEEKECELGREKKKGA